MRHGRENFEVWPPLFASLNNAPEQVTGAAYVGGYSMKARASTTDYAQIVFSAATERTYYARVAIKFVAAPAATQGIFRLNDSTGTILEVSLRTDKTMSCFNGIAAAFVGSNAPALTAETWYVVEVKLKVAAAGKSKPAWRMLNADGTTFHPEQTAEQECRNLGCKFVRAGNMNSGTSVVYYDALGVNDDQYTTDVSWLGNTVETPGPNPVATKCYQGAAMDGDVGILEGTGERLDAPYAGTGITTWNLFEEHAGRKVGIVHYSDNASSWEWDTFGAGASARVHERNAIPLKSMGPSATQIGEILEGKKDAVIKTWAEAAAAFGRPFFFRPWWEMNGTWWTWGRHAKLVEAWQYIYKLIKPIAPNCTFVWCPNTIEQETVWDPEPWYPGAGYVDWTGIDGYVGTQAKKNVGWTTPFRRFKYTYDRMREIAPGKPIVIVETGAQESGGTKATWIEELYESALPNEFPQVKAVLWFNDYIESEGERIKWPIESSEAAKAAYKAKIASTYYLDPLATSLTKGLAVPEPAVEPAQRAKPPLDLHVEIETSTGAIFRLPSDAPVAADRPTGLSFTTQRGDGFGPGSATLSRQIFRDYPDIGLMDTWRFVGRNGEIAYEGRLFSNPRTNDPQQQISIDLVGWMTYLKGRKISPLIIDRRLSIWGEPSIQRRSNTSGDIWGNSSFTTGGQDQGAKGPGLLMTMTRIVEGFSERTEIWAYAGGEDIGFLRYSFEPLGGAAEDANWLERAALAKDDLATGEVPGTDHNQKAALNQSVTGGQGFKYALISDIFGGPGTADLIIYHAWVSPRIIGTHGITEQGAVPKEGYYVSDIIEYVLRTYFPKLKWAGQTNTFQVSQATWHDNPADGYTIIQELNNLVLWETSVWENRTFYFDQADLTTYNWQIRTDDPGVTVAFEGDSIENFANGVAVTYTDVLTEKVRVLYPDDHEEIRDSSDSNPANKYNEKLWIDVEVPWACTETEALQFGKAYLAEFNRPKRPGSYQIRGGYIRDWLGVWHQAWKVRSSETIGILDHPVDEPRLITATSWDDDNKTLTVTVDAPPKTLEAVIARQELARVSRNLNR